MEYRAASTSLLVGEEIVVGILVKSRRRRAVRCSDGCIIIMVKALCLVVCGCGILIYFDYLRSGVSFSLPGKGLINFFTMDASLQPLDFTPFL